VLVPDKASVAAPVFVSVTLVPEMTPLKVPVPDETSTALEVSRLTLLVAEIPEPMDRLVPLPMARAPVPNPAFAPKEMVPAERVVPPE
jgi:hypothetical protein